MIRQPNILPFLLAITLAGLAAAHAEPPESSAWFGEPDYQHFRLEGEEKGKAETSVTTLDTPAGKKEGLRFTVREHCENPLAIMAVAATVRPAAA